MGKTFVDARSLLNKSDYYARIVGKDGKKWSTNIVPNESVVAVSTSPAAGQVSANDTIEVTVNMTEAEFTAAVKAKP